MTDFKDSWKENLTKLCPGVFKKWNLLIQPGYNLLRNLDLDSFILTQLYTESLGMFNYGFDFGYVWEPSFDNLISMNYRSGFCTLWRRYTNRTRHNLNVESNAEELRNYFVQSTGNTLVPFDKFRQSAESENFLAFKHGDGNKLIGVWVGPGITPELESRAKCMAAAKGVLFCKKQNGELYCDYVSYKI